MSRALKRPEQGWAHKPNARLGDWCLLVFILFCGAQFFHWMGAAIDAVISAVWRLSNSA